MRPLILIGFLPMVLSCGRECSKEGTIFTDTIDIHTLRPQGVYYLDGNNKLDAITFNSDSTAVLKYKSGDSTYEMAYKVKMRGKIESSQIKYEH